MSEYHTTETVAPAVQPTYCTLLFDKNAMTVTSSRPVGQLLDPVVVTCPGASSKLGEFTEALIRSLNARLHPHTTTFNREDLFPYEMARTLPVDSAESEGRTGIVMTRVERFRFVARCELLMASCGTDLSIQLNSYVADRPNRLQVKVRKIAGWSIAPIFIAVVAVFLITGAAVVLWIVPIPIVVAAIGVPDFDDHLDGEPGCMALQNSVQASVHEIMQRFGNAGRQGES